MGILGGLVEMNSEFLLSQEKMFPLTHYDE